MSNIRPLLRLSQEAGDQAGSTVNGWSKIETVFWMSKPMSDEVRTLALTFPDLEYRSYAGDPHNRPDEQFIDGAQSIAIAFPRIEAAK